MDDFVWLEITESEFTSKVRSFCPTELSTLVWGDGQTRTVIDKAGKAILKIENDKYFGRK
jgi:hypothetical protein